MNTRFRGIFLLTICLLAFSSVPVASVAAAPERSGIAVVNSTASDHFPDGLNFQIQAWSDAKITKATLYYEAHGSPIVEVVPVTFNQSDQVTIQYSIDLARTYVPPGVTLQYRWHLEDANKNTFDTDWQNLFVDDPRFKWQQLSQDGIVLHWYQGDASYGKSLMQAADTALASARTQTGQAPPTVQIYIYANENDFRAALAASAESWVGGETFPEYDDVLILETPNDVASTQRSIAHEMTHIVTDGGEETLFGRLPSWLDEGLSMVAEGAPDPTFVTVLQQGVQSRSLISIRSLSGTFPEDPEQAALAYAESDNLVRFLVKKYGADKVRLLIQAFRSGDNLDEAFMHALGQDTARVQAAWYTSLNYQPPAPRPQTAGQQPVQDGGSGLFSALGRLLHGLFGGLKLSK